MKKRAQIYHNKTPTTNYVGHEGGIGINKNKLSETNSPTLANGADGARQYDTFDKMYPFCMFCGIKASHASVTYA